MDTVKQVFITGGTSGIGAAIAGSAVFSLNDLCIKQLSGTYALHQVILVRGLVGVAFIS